MVTIRISEGKQSLYDRGWMLIDTCVTYWVKSVSFPGSSISFLFYKRANQKETGYPESNVEVKQKAMFLIKLGLIK